MSYEKRIALNARGLSLSRLVLGAWRLLNEPEKPDADSVARLDRCGDRSWHDEFRSRGYLWELRC